MSDYASSRAAGIAAIDDLISWAAPAGTPSLTAQLAGVGTITQAQYDAVVAERDARQTAINAMKAAAQADLNADAANVAGQGVLTAAGTF